MIVFRRLGTSLANHRASLSSELGSLWDFFRIDRDRRRSAPATYEPIDTKSPSRLAKDLLQVVQETVFTKKLEEKRCPLVKEESDLSSEDDDGTERRIANLIDFFFTIVKSQKEERKNSIGSCFRSEPSPEDKYMPVKMNTMNTDLEHKMETLIEFLATTGCVEKEDKDENKITLMEFLFGTDADKKWDKPIIEIHTKGMSLSESNVNVRNLSYIDETPDDDGNETLVEMLLKYMDGYESKEKLTPKSLSVTPSLSEKSKSDMTISKLETYSDFSKTKSDSTLTHTQDTVIEREESKSSRRISETMVDLSHVKSDLEEIFEEAVARVCELKMIFNDTMTDQEDIENFNMYTKPPQLSFAQYLPYSIELSDIIEEDETSSRCFEKVITQEDRVTQARHCAEELLKYIEERIQSYQDDDDDSSGPSTEEYSREFDLSPSQKSISLVDLRNIPDLPPSAMMKPKVLKVDKSTSTTEISDSISELSKRIDSSCMTEDTTLSSNSERSERALGKLESLHRFFSRSRLEIIDESLEENGGKVKSPKDKNEETKIESELKPGQASLDDVEDLIEDNDKTEKDLERAEKSIEETFIDGDTSKNKEKENQGEKTDAAKFASNRDEDMKNTENHLKSIDTNMTNKDVEDIDIDLQKIDDGTEVRNKDTESTNKD
ncbi:uncharacterized protein LOC121740541 [Aricia agestis]|uniref:uncharacterized protein LOC121740541 n=1 Tax=Aricia agestis TaxID=91739 RepID=UPI001C206013|nr:uncharacterized protein LOC121740541 [Aricia agestis]